MNDRDTDAAAALTGLLNRRGWTLATAESLTGGLVSAAITAVPGASAVFLGGVVAYATDSKHRVLGVPEAVLAQHGPVAAATAAEMAQAACATFGADCVEYSSLGFNNNDHESLALYCPDGAGGEFEVDRIEYNVSANATAGFSRSLDPGAQTAADNDVEANWCDAAAADLYDGVNAGTPGTANPSCP